MSRRIYMTIKSFFPALLLVLCVFASRPIFAGEPETETTTEKKDKFNAGKMILEHVSDNHSWHLWGEGESAVAVPLPVILKTDLGFEFFSSSNLIDHKTHEPIPFKGTYYTYKLNEANHIEIGEGEENNWKKNEEVSGKMIDFSITKNVFALLFGAILMCWLFLSVAKAYKARPGQAPKGLQSFMEPLIMFVRDDIAKPSIGAKHEKFLPFLLSVFFFIWINNLLGLIPILPGGANLTGSISVTIVLAALTFIITMINTNGHYWRHVFAMPGVPIGVLIILTPIEILGVFLKPFVLMVRLFANITAGHIIALAFFSLIFIFGEMNTGAGLGVSVVSLAFTIFMFAMELLVAFLQAYVFTLLSAMYFGGAGEEGHHDAHHADVPSKIDIV